MKWIPLLLLVLFTSCNREDDYRPYAGQRPPAPTTPVSNLIVNTDVPPTDEIDFEQDTITYLALGDSYTIATGEKPENRYPNLLSQALTDRGFLAKAPRIIAANGWTTANLMFSIQNPSFSTKYDLVSLLIGVNNQYGRLPFSVFQKEFVELLEISLSKAKSRSGVFVLSIPDYGVTPFGASNASIIFDEINMYNDFIRKVCETNKIKYYDITEISRKAKEDPTLIANDQLHPSRKMYLEWVDLILKDPPAILNR